jgi:hypothetical protein
MSTFKEFEICSFVRGYHAYQDIWTPIIGEQLVLGREPTNTHDDEAVAVFRHGVICGHFPKLKRKWVFRFLKKSSNTALAIVTGQKVNRGAGYGLEVPVIYKFKGDEFSITWLKSKF